MSHLKYLKIPDVPFAGITFNWNARPWTKGLKGRIKCAYAALNRVPRPISMKWTIPATLRPPRTYLPTPVDLLALRHRMAILVQRIIVAYVPAVEELGTSVEWHIPHQHGKNMREKSQLVITAHPAIVLKISCQ